MASSLKLLLSQSRRQVTILPSLHISPYAYLPRSFSEKPDRTSRPEPISIQPVSYSLKPQQQQNPSPPNQENPNNESNKLNNHSEVTSEKDGHTMWTREDVRYVKNVMPTINPVSYQTRVAPLPEDRDVAEKREDEELDNERNRIEADNKLLRRAFTRVFQEEERVPFPTLIKVEKNKPREILDLSEAIRQVKANAKRNFEETIEAHVNLGVDRRRTDLSVSGTVTLPHGTGKVVKVAVFAEGSAAEEAKAAGAYLVGGVELIEQILNGTAKIDFDTCITTASFMPRVQKIGKILGKKGLMPNPKKGTVVSDITRAVKEAQRGRVSFKMDKTSNVHVGLGKVTFTEENLRENIGAFVNALLLAKPAGLKKTSKYAGYVNSFHICSTMGPGYSVSIPSLSKAADHISRQQVK